jgi:hypothetical protein
VAPTKTLPSKRPSGKGKTVMGGSLVPEIEKATDILSFKPTPVSLLCFCLSFSLSDSSTDEEGTSHHQHLLHGARFNCTALQFQDP